LMFVILPRTGFPLLNVITKGAGSTGFSDSVRLGDISDIQENNAVIFRAEMEKVDPAMLYWRGVVFDHFDGSAWKSSGMERAQIATQGLSGKRVSQTIYLEPYDNRYLFALDKPVSVYFRNAFVSADLTITSRRNIDRLVRYSAVSILSEAYMQDIADRKRYLQLPERDFSRIKTLALKLSAGKDSEGAAWAILQFLKRGDYSYSLKNLPITDNPVEDFLFAYKYGNCEYFASSMAVMLRLAGIPARLAGGYLGGQYNDFGRYYLVTQNTAHVWVEAYIDKKGWIRMDPTPERAATADFEKKNLLLKLRLFFDFINYYWNSLIIDYSFEKQLSLFVGVRNILKSPLRSSLSPDDFMPGAVYAIAAIFIIAALVYAQQRRRTAEKRLVERFCARMKKRGYERMPYEGLEEFALRVDDLKLREQALKFASGFGGLYYRDRNMTREERASLRKLINEIR